MARFALVIIDDGCVERFDFVDDLQTRRTDELQIRLARHRRAAVRPGNGRILVLLFGVVLGQRLVDDGVMSQKIWSK